MLRCAKHSNIVRFVEFYENYKAIYLVTEYCEGGDLQNYIKNSCLTKLGEEETSTILKGVLKGLCYLHNTMKIIHRDVKLGTIL